MAVFLNFLLFILPSVAFTSSLDEEPSECDRLLTYTVQGAYRPRELSLPSIIHTLRALPEEKKLVIATPGNTLYDGTRHNLGFHFFDYLVRREGFSGVTPQTKTSGITSWTESVNISYDDSTARQGEITFFSEPNVFRTSSGEVFLHSLASGQVLILIRAIGDYNETGDFVVPFIEAIGVSSRQLIVVQDNLKIEKLSTAIDPLGPINANGNNAIFSLNRSFATALLPKVVKLIKDHATFGEHIKPEEWDAFTSGFKNLASDLESGAAFRNHEAVSGNVKSFLSKVVKQRVLKTLRDNMVANNSSLRQERGLLMRQLKGNKDITAAEKSRLETELESFDQKNAPALAQEKSDLAQLEAAYSELQSSVDALVAHEMSFRRISIGTGSPADGNNIDFVLGKFDPHEYDDAFFARVYNTLKTVLGQ